MKNLFFKMDKYYSSLYEKTNWETIVKAGFLVEKYEVNHQDEIQTLSSGVILLTTGSFAPMHEGHKNMMVQAKNFLESKGQKVAQVIYSFSHDEYVLNKDQNMPSLSMRVDKAQVLLQDTDFSLSLWEARQQEPINFTTVIEHFQRLYPNNQVVYVFGKDNYPFAHAFTFHGKGLYVPAGKVRPEEYEFINYLPNVEVLPTSEYSNLNSRDIRKLPYLIRDDSSMAGNSYLEFKERLQALIEKKTGHPVSWLNISEQLTWIKNQTQGQKILSLDIYFKGDYNLQCSRLFAIGDEQKSGKQMINRTGSDKLSNQIKNIPEGEYVLVDDDIASGETVAKVKSLLPEGVKVVKQIALSECQGIKNFYDIVDLRDFIIGFPLGGLQVMDKEGDIYRVPYLSPWVNLESRAKIMTKDHVDFSLTVLKLNYQEYINSDLQVKELPEHSQWLLKQGFSDTDKVSDVICSMINSLGGTV